MAECMSVNVCVSRKHAEREEEEEGRRDKRGEGGERENERGAQAAAG